MNIVVRVNSGRLNGLGHFKRVLSLCKKLLDFNYKIIFIVDKLDGVELNLLDKKIKIYEIYRNDKYLDEISDAIKFNSVVNVRPDLIILDDYRFSIEWEDCVKNKFNSPILVFDDICRKHSCEILIDSKWSRQLTVHRYTNLVPLKCIKLLGPKYKIINIKDSTKSIESGCFTIIISIGGGGNLEIISPIIEAIKRLILNGVNVFAKIIAGPFSNNIELLNILIDKNKDNFIIINGQTDLTEHLVSSDLYIGASGGTLYEAIALKVPAVSFELSDNQYNDRYALEDLGHYFHIGNILEVDNEVLFDFIRTLINNYDRVRSLSKIQKIKFNLKAAENIALFLNDYLRKRPINLVENELYDFNSCTFKNEVLVNIDDTDINSYLDARNNVQNSVNMTITANINRLKHYVWWFKNNRKSFFYGRNGIKLLYIWHEKIKIVDDCFLIGGWFVANNKCSLLDAMHAHKLQLEHTDNEYPGLKWLAIINIDNKFVNLMNTRLGFHLIQKDSIYYNKIKSAFPHVVDSQFNFYIR